MQLLDSEQLEYAFQLHGINREGQARQFYAAVWALIQRAEKARDQAEKNDCARELRHLCRRYFSLMHVWQREEEDKFDAELTCDYSLRNAKEARSILPSFEKQFFRYMLCYMDLNRELIQMRIRISRYAKGVNIDSADIMQVNHGTGLALARAHANRLELMRKRLRLDHARDLLRNTDALMERLGEELPRLLGHNEGDHQITLFKGTLRKKRFDQAKNVAQGWKSLGLSGIGFEVIGFIELHRTELEALDGLMLHSGELTLMRSFLEVDEAHINQVLEKFNVPYMVYQYRHLIHQGYLLGKIGSIEGLIIQHAKLLSLSARLHGDPVHAQAQETAVLAPARVLLQDRFKTLGAIFNDMETAIAILEKLMAQTNEYFAHTPIQ